MTEVKKQVFKTRAAWLEYRKGAPLLGGSDVGTIMGVNSFCTPYQYWVVQKSGGIAENENLARGIIKEDAISRLFAQATGEKIVQKSGEIAVYTNSKYPAYMQVAPDRELFAHRRAKRPGLECKDTTAVITELTKETCPPTWYCQVQYTMGIMERDEWYIAVEDGRKELVYSCFPFDKDFFDQMVSYCREWFEKYMLGDEVPPLETGSDAAMAFPQHIPLSVKRVGRECAELVESLKHKKTLLKRLGADIAAIEDKIKLIFEDNESLEYDGMRLATWKTDKNGNRRLHLTK